MDSFSAIFVAIACMFILPKQYRCATSGRRTSSSTASARVTVGTRASSSRSADIWTGPEAPARRKRESLLGEVGGTHRGDREGGGTRHDTRVLGSRGRSFATALAWALEWRGACRAPAPRLSLKWHTGTAQNIYKARSRNKVARKGVRVHTRNLSSFFFCALRV